MICPQQANVLKVLSPANGTILGVRNMKKWGLTGEGRSLWACVWGLYLVLVSVSYLLPGCYEVNSFFLPCLSFFTFLPHYWPKSNGTS
jgi:hypothetical protein